MNFTWLGMAKKHKKKCSILLILREMQKESLYSFAPVDLTKFDIIYCLLRV